MIQNPFLGRHLGRCVRVLLMTDFGVAVLGSLTVSQYLSTWLISGAVEHDLEFRILSLRTDGNTDLCGWPLYYILKKSLAKQVDGVNNNCKENV